MHCWHNKYSVQNCHVLVYITHNVRLMASFSKPGYPKVKSSYHWDRHCGPCFVCGKQQPCYDHFCALTKQHVSSDTPGAYVMLITGKQSITNLTLNTFLYGRKEIKSHNMLACTYIQNASLTKKIIVPPDETQEMFQVHRHTYTIHHLWLQGLNTHSHKSIRY